jgi:hypothetical protein
MKVASGSRRVRRRAHGEAVLPSRAAVRHMAVPAHGRARTVSQELEPILLHSSFQPLPGFPSYWRLEAEQAPRLTVGRYADIGEEEDWATEEAKGEESPEEKGRFKDGKRKGGGAAAGGAEGPKAKKDKRVDAQAELAAAAKGAKRLHGMFAAAARAGPVKSTAPKPVTKDSAAADACVSSLCVFSD